VLGFDETGLAQHAEGTDGLEFPTVEVHEDSANCKSVEEPDETSLSSPAVDTEIAYTEKDEIDRIVANLSLNDDDVQALIAAAGGKERLRFCLQDLHLSGGIDPAAPTANGMLFSFVSCRCRGYDAAPPYHS
jgi:hypothetical protein